MKIKKTLRWVLTLAIALNLFATINIPVIAAENEEPTEETTEVTTEETTEAVTETVDGDVTEEDAISSDELDLNTEGTSHKITLGGEGLVLDGVDGDSVEAGTEGVTVSTDERTTPKGKYISDITSDDVDLDVMYDGDMAYMAIFEMPDKDVTINVVYKDAESYTIDLSSGSAKAYWVIPQLLLDEHYVKDDESYVYYDLDGDGNIDIKWDMTQTQDVQEADETFVKDDNTNLTGSYTLEFSFGGIKYNPIIFVFTKEETKVEESATTEATTEAAAKSPKTGDNMLPIALMMSVSMMGIVTMYIARKKEEN